MSSKSVIYVITAVTVLCALQTLRIALRTNYEKVDMMHFYGDSFKGNLRQSQLYIIEGLCQVFPNERNSVIVHRYLKELEKSPSVFSSGVPRIDDEIFFFHVWSQSTPQYNKDYRSAWGHFRAILTRTNKNL